MFPDLSGLKYVFYALFLTLPLALWKIADIAMWLLSHVSVAIR